MAIIAKVGYTDTFDGESNYCWVCRCKGIVALVGAVSMSGLSILFNCWRVVMFDFNLSSVKLGIKARFESKKKPFYGYTLEKVKGGYIVKYQWFERVWEDMNRYPILLKGEYTKKELINILGWIDWRWSQDFQVYSLEFDGDVYLSWGDCIQHAIDNLVSHAPHLFKHAAPSTLERIKVKTV